MSRTLSVHSDTERLADAVAARISERAREAAARNGRFTLCLSGGNTPRTTLTLLGSRYASRIPWQVTEIFWGDERTLPADHPDNHFAVASGSFLSNVPIPAGNIHRIRGEAGDLEGAAAEYEAILYERFGESGPAFDVTLLGMGRDGHCASTFPGSAACGERTRIVLAHEVVKYGVPMRRITLTVPALAASKEILFLVAGGDKAAMLASVLGAAADVPARWVDEAASKVTWFVDEAAAAHLTRESDRLGWGCRPA